MSRNNRSMSAPGVTRNKPTPIQKRLIDTAPHPNMTEEEFEERMKEVKSLTRVDVEHYIDESMREIKLPDGSSQRIWYHEALAIACEHGTTISTLEDLMRARAERQKIETGIAARRSGTAGNNAVNVSDLGETLESLKM